MLLRITSLSPPLSPTSPIVFSLFHLKTTNPVLFLFAKPRSHPPVLHSYITSLKPIKKTPIQYSTPFSMTKRSNLCTASAILKKSTSNTAPISNKAKKRARFEAPENVLKHKLEKCSKNRDLIEALRLYDDAKLNSIPLGVHHYNVLLYICSSVGNNGEGEEGLGLERGFEIYKQMGRDNVVPNEATFTNAARLAAAKEDPEMAFDLVKQMTGCGILPKLRSYGPALFGFCKKGLADKAYEVDGHMIESRVLGEEQEVSALLKVSSEAKRAGKVYEMMHRLRGAVRQVGEETACIVEDWFRSASAEGAGIENWDVGKVKEGVLKGGGGWHGQGWLGSGKWRVVRTQMDETGICGSCGEKLVCTDIDPRETENFASSLSTLAYEREVKADFIRFQEWLQQNGPFDAVVDGANVGLLNNHDFNFFKINSVVSHLHQMSPSKRLPLVVLHQSRVNGGPAQKPGNQKILERWKKSRALYATPSGSNDDWYWLYAAVSCKCLLVTNDEMRDHLFQLLGTSFFPRWKEKHQVRLTMSINGPEFHMPPPYSIVIQESEQGSWHVPTLTGNDIETPRQWVCATRTRGSPLPTHPV